MVAVVKGHFTIFFAFLYISYIEYELATSLNKYLPEHIYRKNFHLEEKFWIHSRIMSPEHWPIENKAGRAVVRGGLSEAKILCKHQFLLTYQTVLEFWFVLLFFLLWICSSLLPPSRSIKVFARIFCSLSWVSLFPVHLCCLFQALLGNVLKFFSVQIILFLSQPFLVQILTTGTLFFLS